MEIRTVGVCLKEHQPQVEATVIELVEWLRRRGLAVRVDEHCAASVELPARSREEVALGSDLIVVLGGDGTLLSVARAAGTRAVPILGVNLGRLGFLTEVNVEELFPALEKLLAGEFDIVRRMRLDVEVERAGEVVAQFRALNDAVITKTALSRMIDLETRADGVRVTTYHADGLIVCTPTGSTAYSLSAGGPLMVPGLEAIALTPICPHSLTQRPLLLPQDAEIEVRIETRGGEVALTVDGQSGFSLLDVDRVRIHRSECPARIVASPFRNCYEILQAKLHWGER